MQIEISAIRVRKRVRKDTGNMEALMESMRRYGQLSPVIVNRRHELIAGYRRYLAAKQMGWPSISALVVDRESEAEKLELEIEENVQRKSFTPQELADGLARLERSRRPSFWRRIGAMLRRALRGLFGRR
jgi:ParB family chromosome partitioning protein